MNPDDVRTEAPFWWPDMRAIITLMLLVSAIAMAFLFAIGKAMVPESDLAKTTISTILTLAAMSVQYFVGSSRQQSVKDDTIKQQAQTQQVVAATAATMANTASIVAGATNGALESAAWTDAAAKNAIAAFEDYLAKFPTGVHGPEAKQRLAALRSV